MSSLERSYGEPETRRQILVAAREVLGQSGGALTMAGVAKGAGVSRQAVYLHFGDRSGLLVAMVQFIDESLGSAELKAHMWAAPTGAETLQRWVDVLSTYTGEIDADTRVLEAGQYEDDALAAAWRDRMNGRRAIIRTIVERIVADGDLAPVWTVDAAVDLIYVVTMPGLWRELIREQGWTPAKYAEHVSRLLCCGILVSGSSSPQDESRDVVGRGGVLTGPARGS